MLLLACLFGCFELLMACFLLLWVASDLLICCCGLLLACLFGCCGLPMACFFATGYCQKTLPSLLFLCFLASPGGLAVLSGPMETVSFYASPGGFASKKLHEHNSGNSFYCRNACRNSLLLRPFRFTCDILAGP